MQGKHIVLTDEKGGTAMVTTANDNPPRVTLGAAFFGGIFDQSELIAKLIHETLTTVRSFDFVFLEFAIERRSFDLKDVGGLRFVPLCFYFNFRN